MLKTVVANLSHPVRLHWPCARPGFTADNYPVDSSQLYLRQWPEQRFDRQKLCLGASFLERFQPPKPLFGFDACTQPDVRRPIQSPVYLGNSTRSLGEYLKRVLRCPIHNLENGFNERRRHRLMEEIGHGIDKNYARFTPLQWIFEGGFVYRD